MEETFSNRTVLRVGWHEQKQCKTCLQEMQEFLSYRSQEYEQAIVGGWMRQLYRQRPSVVREVPERK